MGATSMDDGGKFRGGAKGFGRNGRTTARALIRTVVVASALVLVPAAAAATNPMLAGPPVSNSGSLSGAVSVAIGPPITPTAQYAYSPSYYSGVLTAVNIKNPAAPLGASAASNALLNASTITIAGGFAYVASKNANGPCLPGPSPMCGSGTNDNGTGNSLSIYDISTNPAVPTFVGSVTDSTKLFGAYGVAVSGHYAYVAAQGCLPSPQPCPDQTVGNRFVVIDISNPAVPTIAASVTNPSSGGFKNAFSHATSVAIHGTDAYVTAFNSSHLTIVDISTPSNPTIVKSLTDPAISSPADVAVSSDGHYAYVASQTTAGTIAVVDVSNPTTAHVVGSVGNASVLSGAYRIRLNGNFAYVSASSVATVTAVNISDPTHPVVAGSLTDPADLHTTTGLDVDPTGHTVVAASPYLSSENKPTFPPYPGSGGPTITGTISTIKIDPTPIGVTIAPGSEPTNPTTQTSAGFTFSATDAVSTVHCSLDGAMLASCTTATSQTYSSLAPGPHSFIVQATDAAGTTATDTYSWTITGPPSAPVNTSLPVISGSATVGQTVSASTGSWSGSPTSYAYKWTDCDASGANCGPAIATSATYTALASDVGSTLEVTVTAKNGIGQSPGATSAPTAVVVAAPPVQSAPVNTTLPAISGTATQGQTLTATNGTWTGSPAPAFTYQWVRCDANGANCSAVTGATQATYRLGAAEVGHALRVFVIGTNAAATIRAISPATAVVSPVNTPPPTAPKLTGLHQAAKTWRESSQPPHAKLGQRKPKHLPTGTTFSLTLDQSASVSFSFTLKTPGRKVKGRCRTQTSRNRHQKRCTIKAASGTLVLTAHKGANQVGFAGHLAHGKKLPPGSYTVTITATASGKRSPAKTLSFTVAP